MIAIPTSSGQGPDRASAGPASAAVGAESQGRVAETSVRTGPSAPRGEPASGGEPASATVLVAGDIASCAWKKDSATARLVDSLPGIVMTAGDNAY
jgi:hypothetical protein